MDDQTQLRPEDAEAVARDIEFCLEAGDISTARAQLGRLIELLSRTAGQDKPHWFGLPHGFAETNES